MFSIDPPLQFLGPLQFFITRGKYHGGGRNPSPPSPLEMKRLGGKIEGKMREIKMGNDEYQILGARMPLHYLPLFIHLVKCCVVLRGGEVRV